MWAHHVLWQALATTRTALGDIERRIQLAAREADAAAGLCSRAGAQQHTLEGQLKALQTSTREEAQNASNLGAELTRAKAQRRAARHAAHTTAVAVDEKKGLCAALARELEMEAAQPSAETEEDNPSGSATPPTPSGASAAADEKMLADLQAAVASMQAQRATLQANVSAIGQTLETMQTKQRGLVRDGDQLAARIKVLQGSRSDRFRLYGDHMPALVQAVRARTDWDVPPLGPIGWTGAVAVCAWLLVDYWI
jgi:DNA repair exonuclease SbcCD ATPase subunit